MSSSQATLISWNIDRSNSCSLPEDLRLLSEFHPAWDVVFLQEARPSDGDNGTTPPPAAGNLNDSIAANAQFPLPQLGAAKPSAPITNTEIHLPLYHSVFYNSSEFPCAVVANERHLGG
eukprot:2236983-Heterocapsa_arctica.AAC.1